MKHITKLSAAVLAVLLNTAAYAEDEDCMGCLELGDIFLTLEAGVSFSSSALLEVETPPWNSALESYNDDLGNSEVLGVGLSYVINQLAVFEIEVARRNSFEYEKSFTIVTPDSPNKDRHFDFQNTTIMANLVLNGSGLPSPFAYRNEYFALDPFVNAGIGISYNTVSDFYSITTSGEPLGAPTSVMEDHTKTGLAYQFGAGLNLRTEENIGIGIGYRYVYGGHFQSNDYIEASAVPNNNGQQIPPWKGQFRTNELYMTLDYYL